MLSSCSATVTIYPVQLPLCVVSSVSQGACTWVRPAAPSQPFQASLAKHWAERVRFPHHYGGRPGKKPETAIRSIHCDVLTTARVVRCCAVLCCANQHGNKAPCINNTQDSKRQPAQPSRIRSSSTLVGFPVHLYTVKASAYPGPAAGQRVRSASESMRPDRLHGLWGPRYARARQAPGRAIRRLAATCIPKGCRTTSNLTWSLTLSDLLVFS